MSDRKPDPFENFTVVPDVFSGNQPDQIDILIDVINQEIKWCIDNPDDVLSKEYQKGFINGLIQAKYFIAKAQKLGLVTG